MEETQLTRSEVRFAKTGNMVYSKVKNKCHKIYWCGARTAPLVSPVYDLLYSENKIYFSKLRISGDTHILPSSEHLNVNDELSSI
jgi:hypothetical protein